INDNGNLNISGYSVTNQGTISGNGNLNISAASAFINDTGATISVGSNLTINDGTFTNNAAISAGSLYIGGSNFANNATISAANLNITDSGAFTNSAGATISANTSGGSGQIYFYSGQAFDNEGTIEVTNGDTLRLTDYAYGGPGANTNNGTISVG